MSSPDWDLMLGDQLRVTIELPLAATESAPTSPTRAAALLDALGIVETGRTPASADERHPDDRLRLELKVDLLMHLMTVMLQDRLPPVQPMTISLTGLIGPAGAFPASTDRLVLYPSAELPIPLVIGVENAVVHAGACGARWAALEPVLADALGRWIFRVHRREIAKRRGSDGTGQPPASA